MRLNRADRSLVGDWWYTVDKLMLSALLILMGLGLLLSLAASPPVAERLGVAPYYFVHRHALMLVPGVIVLVAASMLPPRMVRRASLGLFFGGLALIVLTLFSGQEVKGATRWLQVGAFSLQASELVKPAFVVLVAWCFAESQRHPDMPAVSIAIALYAMFAALLIVQPDFGQTLLITMVWGGLFFVAGGTLLWVVLLGGIGAAGITAAYFTVPHVTARIDRFLDPTSGDSYQTDRAIESFLQGGWFGKGPGEGTVKHVLPDSHTDFVFAVVAEEFGLIACMALAALFAFIVVRGMARAAHEPDGFIRHALMGLVMLFGFQTIINLGVNTGLLPAKGMTLPFISYGGSSMIGTAITMGFVLALSRRRPRSAPFEDHVAAPAISERENSGELVR